jgi:hypothetical protein
LDDFREKSNPFDYYEGSPEPEFDVVGPNQKYENDDDGGIAASDL